MFLKSLSRSRIIDTIRQVGVQIIIALINISPINLVLVNIGMMKQPCVYSRKLFLVM